jgi:hypothetical protein
MPCNETTWLVHFDQSLRAFETSKVGKMSLMYSKWTKQLDGRVGVDM